MVGDWYTWLYLESVIIREIRVTWVDSFIQTLGKICIWWFSCGDILTLSSRGENKNLSETEFAYCTLWESSTDTEISK